MSAEAYREDEMYSEAEPDIINIKREQGLPQGQEMGRMPQRSSRQGQEMRRRPAQQGSGTVRTSRGTQRISQSTQRAVWEQEVDMAPRRSPRQGREMEGMPRRSPRQSREMEGMPRRSPRQGREMEGMPRRSPRQGREMEGMPRRSPRQSREMEGMPRRSPRQGREMEDMPRRSPRQSREVEDMPRRSSRQGQEMRRTRAEVERKRAAARRRRIVKMQRMVLFAGVFCIALLCGILYMKRIDVKAEEQDIKEPRTNTTNVTLPVASTSGMVQGLAAEEFAKHPEWEENFLTPNEYSRPGEPLEEVNNIFVHYTANPKTSAAQNRSYFEQLKDTHITSASAHFIIGYNGEIIQCIPLDEIAYAVQTRNYDSVSIECCYKSADGSFTQETYDSLIELLAWLTDVYDLKTDDILRHYDCGGKKCPIYYTEHEDAWERLKKDVGEKL